MEYLVIPWLYLVSVTMAYPVIVAIAWALPLVIACELRYRGIISLWWARGIAIGALVYVLLFVVGYVLLSEAMKGMH
jgi:hypothetical protein